ncbi:enoyl-CoA hydratase/isomerase family protein [Aliiroseovarius crassostreae]|uniref:enoyl-CoA hydratase-related protein n=1 Tax=Aliiroseovarius crassostreae TaxID=154981 RepID=UPI0021AEAE7A|nr:enoyl-CoA hydratase-related protein [Aliiroseovarius crassostreae]UWQ06989.1 enoyl-CoA hydratase/isomerase family protein [Aliiroseovarius crassostreae]UWQ10094.1 enoyl-CoA hydratase/isomerase family protein [Aliiroseovarius crassostreae]
MKYDTITYEITDGLAVLTLNRPDKMNALNTQMRAEIAHAVTDAGNNARALVIVGEGRAFCSGQDLGDRANADSVDLERTLKDEYEPLLQAIYNAPIPVICAVNGAAAGAGANIALAADVVIAKESAYFMQAFSRIGLIPDAGGTYWMPRTMGFAKAMGAALFAEKLPAKEAAELGLIWECVADDDFEAAWKARGAYLANGPTMSFANIKKAMRASLANSLDEQLALEAQLQGECGRSRDFKEGVLAFLEKRTPKYEGR